VVRAAGRRGYRSETLPSLALSIGCGSLYFNYANHADFSMVKESFGMTMGEATDYHPLGGLIHRGCGRVFAAVRFQRADSCSLIRE